MKFTCPVCGEKVVDDSGVWVHENNNESIWWFHMDELEDTSEVAYDIFEQSITNILAFGEDDENEIESPIKVKIIEVDK
jgi:hypothetical protein